METPEALSERGASRDAGALALAVAAAYFVALFLPWISSISAWSFRSADDSGLLALALVFVEFLRHIGGWNSRGADLWAVCLTAAAGVMGVTTFVTVRWGSGPLPFAAFKYGAWLGLAFAIVLALLGVFRLITLQRSVL